MPTVERRDLRVQDEHASLVPNTYLRDREIGEKQNSTTISAWRRRREGNSKSMQSSRLEAFDMATSSPTKSKLSNSYFFYGTHPLKVPEPLTHSNSSMEILSATVHHSSLQLPSRHAAASAMPTTKSMDHFSRLDNEQESEVKRFVNAASGA